MRSGRAERGFTYIGLLVAIALIGFALAVAGQVTRTTMKREREVELLFIGHEYRHAIARFFRQNHRYPLTLEELVTVDTGGTTPQHYLRRLYRDPMTRAVDWTLLPAPGQGIMGIASSSNKAPLKSAGFDVTDESFEQAQTYADWIFLYDPRGRVGVPIRQ
ncbi:MAG TPA: type II secretion system protein [Steroidobacteraceae bacterium]|jgi:type II secretory pathway pseudopilin PulG|nr:type II secretion system protein [Steroidobacteraceae bacterium]